MWKTKYSKSIRSASYQTKEINPRFANQRGVFHRQSLVPGFQQEKLAQAKAMLVGAGGINGEIGEGLARKGIGTLRILDADLVQLSNLNRQMFTVDDLYKNKALSLAKNLAGIAPGSTLIEAHAYNLEDFLALGIDFETEVVVVGVDHDNARYLASEYFLGKAGVVFIAVDETADHGYVFIQEKLGKPCFHCLYPKPSTSAGRKRCTPAGAVKDILKVVAGMGLYAVDSLLMDRKRDWNYRHISLAGFAPDTSRWVQASLDCPVCGRPNSSSK